MIKKIAAIFLSLSIPVYAHECKSYGCLDKTELKRTEKAYIQSAYYDDLVQGKIKKEEKSRKFIETKTLSEEKKANVTIKKVVDIYLVKYDLIIRETRFPFSENIEVYKEIREEIKESSDKGVSLGTVIICVAVALLAGFAGGASAS